MSVSESASPGDYSGRRGIKVMAFSHRRSSLRRAFLAAITSWSIGVSACVPPSARISEPTPSLAGRDSVVQAYDLGRRDAKLSAANPLGAFKFLIPFASLAAGALLARATHQLVWLVVPGEVLMTGARVVAVRDAHKPAPMPADSMQSIYGL